jgi:hypothetical protein
MMPVNPIKGPRIPTAKNQRKNSREQLRLIPNPTTSPWIQRESKNTPMNPTLSFKTKLRKGSVAPNPEEHTSVKYPSNNKNTPTNGSITPPPQKNTEEEFCNPTNQTIEKSPKSLNKQLRTIQNKLKHNHFRTKMTEGFDSHFLTAKNSVAKNTARAATAGATPIATVIKSGALIPNNAPLIAKAGLVVTNIIGPFGAICIGGAIGIRTLQRACQTEDKEKTKTSIKSRREYTKALDNHKIETQTGKILMRIPDLDNELPNLFKLKADIETVTNQESQVPHPISLGIDLVWNLTNNNTVTGVTLQARNHLTSLITKAQENGEKAYLIMKIDGDMLYYYIAAPEEGIQTSKKGEIMTPERAKEVGSPIDTSECGKTKKRLDFNS